MNKKETLDRIEQEWKTFLASVDGLSVAALLEPGAVGEWSVRDVMAHVATWEEEALNALPVILDGKSPPRYVRYGGIDAFNALERERKRRLSRARVKRELAATHRRLVEFLENIPEAAYKEDRRLQRRIREDAYRHYREHALQILSWRNARGSPHDFGTGKRARR